MKKISSEVFTALKKSAGIRVKIAEKMFNFLFSEDNKKLKGEYQEEVKVMTGKDDIALGHLPALQKLIAKAKINAEVGGVIARKNNRKGDEVSRLTAIAVNYK